MKLISNVSYYLLIILIAATTAYSQEMKPDAAKLYNAGNKLLKSGDYLGAVGEYDKALAIEKDYRTYYQKGMALKKANKYDEAKDAFETCLKLNPNFEGGYNALGGVYFSLGKYEEAANNFEKVIETAKNPNVKKMVQVNLALTYTKLGTLAMADGNSNKAIGFLLKAVQNSNYDAAYLALAKIYSETGSYDKSIEAAENALKYRKTITKGGPYYYMGVDYKAKGDLEKAKEMFTQAKQDATYRKTAEYELTALK
jgi:tetratricopeptide (TPR) repeat protein